MTSETPKKKCSHSPKNVGPNPNEMKNHCTLFYAQCAQHIVQSKAWTKKKCIINTGNMPKITIFPYLFHTHFVIPQLKNFQKHKKKLHKTKYKLHRGPKTTKINYDKLEQIRLLTQNQFLPLVWSIVYILDADAFLLFFFFICFITRKIKHYFFFVTVALHLPCEIHILIKRTLKSKKKTTENKKKCEI